MRKPNLTPGDRAAERTEAFLFMFVKSRLLIGNTVLLVGVLKKIKRNEKNQRKKEIKN